MWTMWAAERPASATLTTVTHAAKARPQASTSKTPGPTIHPTLRFDLVATRDTEVNGVAGVVVVVVGGDVGVGVG